MIIAHRDETITLHDGVTEHEVRITAFDWLPDDSAYVSDTYLQIPPGDYDLSRSLIAPVEVLFPDGNRLRFFPIPAYLVARYGPDNHRVTVPINGDVHAQRLHWRLRSEREREEMRSVLMCLNAWRLTDDGQS